MASRFRVRILAEMGDRFYTNSPLAPGPAVLQSAEAHHIATVLRCRVGDRIVLFNGDGCEYAAEVVAVNRKRVAVQVTGVETPPRELPFRLVVAAPLPRGNRGDFLLEKLTELGVSEFVLLRTERSVVHPRETKLERLERAVIEASKQCGRNVLMRIHGLTDWATYCRRDDLPPVKVFAHPGEAEPAPSNADKSDVVVAVGPEGGFTAAEVQAARQAGWRCVSLGPRILRVETAAIVLVVRASRGA